MDTVNNKLKLFNKVFGWLHPFAWVTYSEYAKSMDIYIEMLRIGILRESPQTLNGHQVIFHIKPEIVTKLPEMVLILAPDDKLRVFCDPGTEATEPFEARGIAKVQDGWTSIDMRSTGHGRVETDPGTTRLPGIN